MGKKLTVGRASRPKRAAVPRGPAAHFITERESHSAPPPAFRLAALPDIKRAKDFSASDAKAKLGEVIDLVAAVGIATITRRGRQRFVVMQLETAEALFSIVSDYRLESLGGRYNALVATMQTEESKSAVDSLFSASAEEIGAAAANAVAGGGIDTAIAAKRKVEQRRPASGRKSAKSTHR
jgi:prevent-host-death family protein